MNKIGRWLEGVLGVAALSALAVLLTVLFSQAARSGRTPAQGGISTSPVETQTFQSPLPTWPYPDTPTPEPTPTFPPILTPLPTPVVTPIPVAQAPFIPGIEGRATRPYQIVFRQENTFWIMNNDGSDRRVLLDAAKQAGLYLRIASPGAEWPGKWDASPDGTQLAFTAFNSGKLEQDQEYKANIYLLDVATGAVRLLVDGSVQAWSPDGKQIACLREYNLWVVDAATGQGKRILDIEAGYAVEDVTWAPGGKEVAFTYKVAAQEGGEGGVLAEQLDRPVTRQLVPIKEGYAVGSPSWSPSGEYVFYLSLAGDRSGPILGPNLWMVTADGNEQTQVTRNIGVEGPPRWSADGKWVAFTGAQFYTEPEANCLWLVSPDGTLRRVSEDLASRPYWSPDGTELVFQKYAQGIWVLNLSNGNLKQVYAGDPEVPYYDVAILGRAG